MPPGHADERTTLKAFLDLYRQTMVMKIEDLDEEQARFRPTEQANSLLILIQHLTGVEMNWFQDVIAGRASDRDRDAEFAPLETATVEEAVAAYKEQWAKSDEILAGVGSLDDACRGESGFSVRWVLLHMLEEIARHAGHADITRELIDGTVGF
jgi:uncharacterized damage-inducible protein DinB